MNGEIAAERMNIEQGAGVWIMEDCAVVEVENDYDCKAYQIYMVTSKGSISRQDVIPVDADDSDECRAQLDRGESPVGAWEDVNCVTVRPDAGTVVDGCVVITEVGCDEFVKDAGDSDDDAVRLAGDVWDHLSSGDKATHTVTAYRVEEGFMEAGTTQDILWSSEDLKMTPEKAHDIACALYDGGWRSTDLDELRQEYDFTADEADMVAEELAGIMASRPAEWHGTKPVRVSGTSKVVAITEACKALGLQSGEYVEVTIRRL